MRSRVILALFLAVSLTVPLSTAHAAPTLQQQYLDIYLKINDAQHLQQQGDFIGALDDFEDCYKKLEHIHDENPEWETALVVHRMADCQKMIMDLKPKADAQEAAREVQPTPPPTPAPAIVPVPSTNVATPNPVPADVQPVPTENASNDEVASLKLQLSAVKEELRITKEHLKESQAQLETYRVQLQTVNEQLESLKNQQSPNEQMGKLLTENKKLNDKLAEAQKELEDYKSNPTTKLAMAQAQIKNLEGEYAESQEANKALQDTTTALKSQLDAAQADLVAANQKLAAVGTASPEYATLKRENEVMRDILTRELQEQAHRDMAKRLAQEEFDNLKLKSQVLQQNLDILATPMTPASTDEERALLASLKVPAPDVNQPSGNSLSAPAAATGTTTPPATTPATTVASNSTPSSPATPDASTNAPAVEIVNPPAPADTAPSAPTSSEPAPLNPSSSTPAPSSGASTVGASSPSSSTPAAPDPTTTPVPPSAPLGSMPASTNAADSSTPDTNAPTTTQLPPATTVVQDTTIKHGGESAPDANDPVDLAHHARLPDDMRDTAQDAADLFKNQKYDESAAKYQSIIDKYPESLYAWSNLGVVRFQQGKFEDALKALQQAVKLSPTDAFSYSNLGIVYYQLGQYENAIDALNSAKALDPNDAKTHNYLGCACSQKGWQEVAEKEFRKAIEIDPNFGDAHFNLALVYATSKPPSLELARREYNSALELGIAKDARLEKLLNNGGSAAAAQ